APRRLLSGEGTLPSPFCSRAAPRSLTPRRCSHRRLASRLRLTGCDANDPDRRRRGQHRRGRARDARGRADPGRRGARRREAARADRDALPARHRMAARVAPAAFQAGADPAAAYRRLSAAYQQTLRYAEDVKRLYQQVHRSIYQSLLGLANALEAKDAYTRGHSERVGAASRRVAVALGLQSQEADIVGQAGLLHDIGKIGVPEAVLRKRVELDDDEWALMRKHPLIGAQIVSPFEFFAV